MAHVVDGRRRHEGASTAGILGPVVLFSDDGHELALPSRGQRAVIALLAVAPGRTASPASLAQRMAITEGGCRTIVGRVRRLLGADLITTTPGGYRLGVPTDRDQMVKLLAAARWATPSRRLDLLTRALRLIRGDALADFRSETWAGPHTARMDEEVLGLREARADALLVLGRPSDAIADLRALVAGHPLRDRGCALLMEALAAEGRLAEALQTYRLYHDRLRDEFGTEPSKATREIQSRIATTFGTAAGDAPRVTRMGRRRDDPPVPLSEITGAVTFVPVYNSPLIGRDAEVAQVAAMINRHALVTLVGPPGVGKTRLAASIAASTYDDGRRVSYAELASITADDVVHAVARAAGVPTPSVDELLAHLRTRRGLLVLDNCEHVRDEVAVLVGRILQEARAVTVLVTSRQAIDIDGEHVHRVAPLDPISDGARLFVDRARSGGADLDDDDLPVVRAICRRLDGLPLAIEIAASRAAALGVVPLCESLDERLAVLRRRPRAGSRHSTLDDAVDWSFQMLSPAQRRAFLALGTFVAGFELDAAIAVLSRLGHDPGTVPDLVAGLIEHSLIHRSRRDGTTRYRLLETLRAFALGRLGPEEVAVRRAHADWVASITQAPSPEFHGEAVSEMAVRLEREVGNWRAAASFAIHHGDSRLAACLCGLVAAAVVLGRADLAPLVVRLGALAPRDHPAQYAVATAQFAEALIADDEAQAPQFLDGLADVDPADTLGLERLLRSGYLIMRSNRVGDATRLRMDIVDDPNVPGSTRDNILANTFYGVLITGREDLVGDGWQDRVTEIADTSRVAHTRLLANLAVAWALRRTDPEASEHRISLALSEDGPMPLFFRRTWAASVGRFLTATDPPRAAAIVLSLLNEQIREGYADDLTVLVGAASILVAADHSAADDAVATVASLTGVENLARTVSDVGDRQARGRLVDPDTLTTLLRTALADVAGRGQSTGPVSPSG